MAEQPGDPVLLHALARAAFDLQRYDLAVAYAGLAVKTDPRGAFHITLGLALRCLGHAAAGLSALRVAALTDPDNPSTHLALFEALEADGEIVDAEAELRFALELRPMEAGYHLVLARFLERQGRFPDAREAARRATRLAASDDVASRQNEAQLLARMGEVQAAEPLFARIRDLQPDDPAALANHGAMLFELGRFDQAADALEQSVEHAPPTAETLTNLGLVRMAVGDLAGADEVFSQAESMKPEDARIMLNRGTLLNDLGRRQDAEKLFRRVMAEYAGTPDAVRARFNLATVELAEGRFEEGWGDFEARKTLVRPLPRVDLADWDGTERAGPVLLCGEQGLGDFIQFLRFVPQAAARAPVTLLVPETLHRLVEDSFELPFWQEMRRIGRLKLCSSATDSKATVRASVLSLPRLLGENLPGWGGPYLLFYPEKSLKRKKALRVGLCWAGNPNYRFDRRRSIDFDLLAPLLNVPGIQWVSLTAIKTPDGLEPLPEGDMASTAAVISSLDLVISVDTAIAHLAGAMGKPFWLLNRFGGDWRWAEGNWDQRTGRHLWYPQVRLFEQQTSDLPRVAWRDPVSEVAAALTEMASRPSSIERH
nr:tetratricopeptide repeat protein [Acetobacter conturbans]